MPAQMFRPLLTVFVFVVACSAGWAETLKQYRWKHRVIVSFAANKSDPLRIELLKQIERHQCEFRNRDLIHIDLLLGSKDYQRLSKQFSVTNAEFRLVLVGKDGEVKLNSEAPSLDAVFSLIDTMSMRQREQLNDKC